MIFLLFKLVMNLVGEIILLVMKACSKVQKKLEKDMNYRQAIDDIKKKLV